MWLKFTDHTNNPIRVNMDMMDCYAKDEKTGWTNISTLSSEFCYQVRETVEQIDAILAVDGEI